MLIFIFIKNVPYTICFRIDLRSTLRSILGNTMFVFFLAFLIYNCKISIVKFVCSFLNVLSSQVAHAIVCRCFNLPNIKLLNEYIHKVKFCNFFLSLVHFLQNALKTATVVQPGQGATMDYVVLLI